MNAKAEPVPSMPPDIRQALSHALDRLTVAREVRRIKARPAGAGPRIMLTRRTRQRMMTLLRLASHQARGRPARNDGVRTVWSWLRHLGLDGGADGLLAA